jgi:hypothetical protein
MVLMELMGGVSTPCNPLQRPGIRPVVGAPIRAAAGLGSAAAAAAASVAVRHALPGGCWGLGLVQLLPLW